VQYEGTDEILSKRVLAGVSVTGVRRTGCDRHCSFQSFCHDWLGYGGRFGHYDCVGLCYWSRNRYRMSLHTIEQGLFEDLQQKNEEVIKALRDAHHEAVLLASARQVEAERMHLKALSTDLARRFEALSKRLGGREQEKTEQGDAVHLSVETQIADLAQRFDALSKRLDAAVIASQNTVGGDHDSSGGIVELLKDS